MFVHTLNSTFIKIHDGIIPNLFRIETENRFRNPMQKCENRISNSAASNVRTIASCIEIYFEWEEIFFSIFFIVLDRQWQIKIRSVLRISKKITNWIFNVDGNVKHKNIKVHEKCTIHLTSQSLNSKAQLNNWFESIEFRFSVENDLPVTWRRRRKKRMRLAR